MEHGRNTRIRSFRAVDRDEILALAPRLNSGVAPWREPEAVAESVRSWVVESLDQRDPTDRPVFVAEEAGRIVGFVTAGTRRHWAGDVDAYVGELVVAADVTSRGIGRRLMAAVESWALSAGHCRITLETGAGNHGTRAFYAALGYEDEELVLSRALVERN